MNTNEDSRVSIEEFINVFILANTTLHENIQHCKANIKDYQLKKTKAQENINKTKTDQYN